MRHLIRELKEKKNYYLTKVDDSLYVKNLDNISIEITESEFGYNVDFTTCKNIDDTIIEIDKYLKT